MKTLKKSLKIFWKKNLAFFNLAILNNIEYRFNFLIDILIQPFFTAITEIFLWSSLFLNSHLTLLNGFTENSYLSYALWASFISRITTNWMYEFKMVEEIYSGSINSLLTRPISFYEYYLSQLLGYKFVTTIGSLGIPIMFCLIFKLPLLMDRIPLAIVLCFYYLLLVHTISFIVSILAFYFTKISSFTVAKNLLLWVLMGELFPLDLFPEKIKNFVILSPFSSGVYLPVSYLTGRISVQFVYQGFYSVTIALILLNFIGYFGWKQALKNYSGTGA